jgi:hypothetical protein
MTAKEEAKRIFEYFNENQGGCDYFWQFCKNDAIFSVNIALSYCTNSKKAKFLRDVISEIEMLPDRKCDTTS